uniref:Expansin-like EG45 domain-containing protein n=1 Tax=Globisporangium ultimum (strain ATCC 200006 / CBS 805.95 / DAOM BR144) TaxID=431595 RepID=K3W6A0_GLOUD
MAFLYSRAWLVAALLALAGAAADDTYFEGDGTTYTLGQVSAGNCNFMAAAAAASDNYAAINDPQWNAMKNCGRCAEVSCTDDSCADKTTKAVVYILDRCPECKQGDLDLSPSVFTKLTGSTPSRKKIKWRFVDCPVSGSIKYCLKGGSNAFWTAIQPANTVAGVASVAINGKTPTMVDSAYYYLLNGNGAVQTDLSSVKVTLTSVGGEIVEETVALTAGSCTDGKLQFATGKGGSSGGQQTTAAPATQAPATQAPATTTAAPTQTQTPTPTAAAQTPEPSTVPEVGSDAEDQLDGFTSTPELSTTTATTNQTSSTTSTDFRGLDSNAADEAGTVSAPDQSSSSIVTMLTPTPTSSSASSVAKGASSSDDGVSKANVKSDAGTDGTSPVLMVLLVAAAVAIVALAVVAAISKKKKLDDKRNDRDEAAMQRSFGNFHSPVRVNADIAAL